MAGKITAVLEQLRNQGKKALIPYITAGDPSLEATEALIGVLEQAGAHLIELGIPYSDPLADGPVIQRAGARALAAGFKIRQAFDLVKRTRERTQIPILFLVYYNSVLAYGIDAFLQACLDAGVDGLIIPDLPLEERRELKEKTANLPLELIPLIAPTSGDRMAAILQESGGFVYCISSRGVTGKRDRLETDIVGMMEAIRALTPLPLALGFGISGPEMVARLKDQVDGLIVGSAIVERIEQGLEDGTWEAAVADFVAGLHQALLSD